MKLKSAWKITNLKLMIWMLIISTPWKAHEVEECMENNKSKTSDMNVDNFNTMESS